MQSLHLAAFLEQSGPIPDTIFKAISEPPSTMITLLEGSDEYSSFMSRYEAYTEETLRGKHGSIAQ